VSRLLLNGTATVLATAGVAMLLLLAYALNWSDWRGAETRDLAALAAFGVVLVIGAALLLVSSTRRSATCGVRFPPLWVGVVSLVAAIAAGLASAHWGWLPLAEPFVAIVGLAGLFSFIGRLATRWAPATIPRAAVLRSTVWGMFGATTSAIVLQVLFASGAIVAVIAGLALVDPAMVRDFVERIGAQGTLDEFSGNIVNTMTVSFALFAMYAVAAPITEEFTKIVGVAIIHRGSGASLYAHFVTGVCVGLGFSVVETLGYSMAAGESWPWLLLLRSPVAFIHVTATAFASCGLYHLRTRGGYRFVLYFIGAVVIHGMWNGLSVTVMLVSMQASSASSISPLAGLLIVAIVALLALVLTGCIAWTILTARRLGRAEAATVHHAAVATGHSVVGISTVGFERSEARGISP